VDVFVTVLIGGVTLGLLYGLLGLGLDVGLLLVDHDAGLVTRRITLTAYCTCQRSPA
jgi:hypothetical protein